MSSKPTGLVYGVDDSPPLAVNILSGVQHSALMLISLMYAVLVAQAAGSSAEVIAAMVSLTLITMAIGTLLQAIPMGPVGSGFLCQPSPTVIYLVPSLIAARTGHLAVVFGMTAMAGAAQVVLARVLPRLRALFTPEITGLVVLLVGISSGVVGLRIAFGAATATSAPSRVDMALSLATLALMVALNVWGRGALRLFCVLIGMAAGYLAAWALGLLDTQELAYMAAAPLFATPATGHLAWSFDASLVLPFLVAAVAASLKVIGNVTTSQKANQANWVRADMRTISKGVMADGIGNIVAGAIGSPGINSSTSAVGLATATGVASRRIAYSIAAVLLVFAFVPKLGYLFNLMPRSVLAAALVFASTFIITNGLVIVTSRLLDSRKILVIGLAIVFGLAVEIFPTLLAVFPPVLRLSLGNSLVFGTLVGLALTLLFRIGLRRSVAMTVPAGRVDRDALDQFLDAQGAAWGARRDVIESAKFNLAQSIETLMSSGVAAGPLVVEASFDEFNLDLRVSYDGEQLELPEMRPSLEEILGSDEGERKLAGFLLRRSADRVAARRVGNRATILFHFDH